MPYFYPKIMRLLLLILSLRRLNNLTTKSLLSVDTEIKDFLANKDLNFTATLDKELAYKDADFV